MKRRLFGRTLVLGLLVLSGSSAADKLLPPVPVPADLIEPTRQDPETVRARKDGLEALVALAQNGDPARLGFAAPPKINDIVALDPFQEALVQVSDLKTFGLTKDPNSIIKLQARETYPIALRVSGQPVGNAAVVVVSSLTLAKKGPDWRATSFGSPNLMRAAFNALLNARDFKLPGQAQPLLLRGTQQHYLLVRITGLNKFFLGAVAERVPKVPNQTTLYLIPIFDSARLGFMKGVPQLASTVFAKLKGDALLHNGLPT